MHTVKVSVGDWLTRTEVEVEATRDQFMFLLEVGRLIANKAGPNLDAPDMYLEVVND